MAKKEPNYRLRMILMIVLAFIMVLIAAGCVIYRTWVVKPDLPTVENSKAPTASDGGGNETGAPSVPAYDPVQPKVSGERKSEDCYTILVFGADESSSLTDTMMVVSYDVTNQKATVMSIPRDTLINSKAYGVDSKKMNAVYARYGGGEAGINALRNEVSELVGFTPDYYVKIDWELVGQMVDAIGGVYFEVPWDMWYSDPYQNLHIDLKEGYQLLNGDQAMQLVRWRKNMDPNTFEILAEHSVGDVGRLKIQQDFLKAVLKQVLQLKNVTRISELAEIFGQNVVSDLSIENLFWFGSQAIMGGLSVDGVEFLTMPFAYGTYPVRQNNGGYSNRSFVYPVQKSLLNIINEKLNPFVDSVTLRELDLVYVNSAGGISSTTGVLADPSMAALTEEYLKWKEEQENPNPSGDPSGTDEPNGSDEPVGSGDPTVTETPPIFDVEDPEPVTSETPAASEEPAPSEEPTVTETPDVSGAPSSSEEPEVSETPFVPPDFTPDAS